MASIISANKFVTVGGHSINHAVSTSVGMSHVSEIIHSTIDGSISDRFKNYADYYKHWSNPSSYQKEIISNGNNIKKVINPTKEDYLLAIENGCRPEFIDHNLITLIEIQEFIESKPHKFI